MSEGGLCGRSEYHDGAIVAGLEWYAEGCQRATLGIRAVAAGQFGEFFRSQCKKHDQNLRRPHLKVERIGKRPDQW